MATSIDYCRLLDREIVSEIKRLFRSYGLGRAFETSLNVFVEEDFRSGIILVSVHIPMMMIAADISIVKEAIEDSLNTATSFVYPLVNEIEREMREFVFRPQNYFKKRFESYIKAGRKLDALRDSGDESITTPTIRKVRE